MTSALVSGAVREVGCERGVRVEEASERNECGKGEGGTESAKARHRKLGKKFS